MWPKGRIANWLLLGLIPGGLLGFLLFLAYVLAMAVNGPGDTPDEIDTVIESMTAMSFFSLWVLWWIALLVGVPLRIWATLEERGLQRQGQSYAELHGWQPISRTQWKSFKRGGVTLTVTKSTQSNRYLLNIEINGEVVATDGFESSYFALHFGDYLWNNVLSTQSRVSAQDVRQQRARWEAAALPALRAGGGPAPTLPSR